MATKFNKFAKDLRFEFIKAREKYAAAYEKLTAAETALSRAKTMQEKFFGEKLATIQKCEGNLKLALANFNSEAEDAWSTFNARKKQIGAELAAAVAADRKLDPNTIDANAVKLLESGALSADDFNDFVARYSNNRAMLLLIEKHASDIATDEKLAYDTRRPFMFAARKAKEVAEGTALQNWEQLSSVCDTLSGQSHGRGEPLYTTRMNSRFEELADPMIEAF